MKRTKQVIFRWLLKSAIGFFITAGVPFAFPWGVQAQAVPQAEAPSVQENFLMRRFFQELPALLAREGRTYEEIEVFAAMVQDFLGANHFDRVVADAQGQHKPITLSHFAAGLTEGSATAQEFASGFSLPLHWDSAKQIQPYELTLHFAGRRAVTVEIHSPSAHSEHTFSL